MTATPSPVFRMPTPPRSIDPFDGILLVDKPSGPTSHDIVDAIRRRFKLPKVGHGGTLDPQATGLLVLLLERATKLADHFTNSDKAYEGTLLLGVATDSYDADGRIVREADYRAVTREQLEERMRAMVGDLMQAPPMVSAVKVHGVPLYKLARRGETVERKPRLVHVYELSLKTFDPPEAAFSIRCTKGTYVRSICADIGDALGCGAHLNRLRRTQCGAFSVNDAMPLDALLNLTSDALQARVITLRTLALSGVI
jgi:tRNA pseudouridine55 synthase